MGKKHRRPQGSRVDQAAERAKQKRRVRRSVAALCAAGLVAGVTSIGAGYTTCYAVEYQGVPVAYVDSKAAFLKVIEQTETLTAALSQGDIIEQEMSTKPALAPREEVSAPEEAAGSVLDQVPELTRVYTITVDGTYIGAAASPDIITEALEKVKDTYRTPETISVELESQVDLDYRFEAAGTETMDADAIAEKLLEPTTKVFPYITQAGDTMTQIAEKFSMTRERLEELNQWQEFAVEGMDADFASADADEILGDTQLIPASEWAAEPEAESSPVEETPAWETAEPAEEWEAGAQMEEPVDPEAAPLPSEGEVAPDDIVGANMIQGSETWETWEEGYLPMTPADEEALARQALEQALAAVRATAIANGEAVQEIEEPALPEASLQAGQEMKVEQTCSLLAVSTVEEQIENRVTEPEKLTLLDSSIDVGQEEVLIEGVPGEATVLSRVTKRCGVPVSVMDLNAVTKVEAEPLLVAVGYGTHPELYDIITQGGGVIVENTSGPFMFQWPVQGHISSDYGYRYIFGGLNFHGGVDIPAPMGTAVHAGADGTVIWVGPKGTYGNLVIIDHGNGFQSYYAHNSSFAVRKGDVVTRGQIIAGVGSTGRSTGPHCHFEVHYNGQLVDPLMYLPGDNNAPMRSQIPASEIVPPEEIAAENGEETKKPEETKPEQAAPAESEPAPAMESATIQPGEPLQEESIQPGEDSQVPQEMAPAAEEAEPSAEPAPAEQPPAAGEESSPALPAEQIVEKLEEETDSVFSLDVLSRLANIRL